MGPPWEWLSPQDRGEHATACKRERPQKTPLHPSVFHTENRFSRVFPRSGLASLGCYSFIPPWPPAASWPNPLHPHSLFSLGPPSQWRCGGGGNWGRRLVPVNTPTRPVGLDASTPPPITPYPGLHQLRPLASLGQECHNGARGAFPRLGLRGEGSGPSGQSWRETSCPQGEMRPLPASHARPR